MQANSGRGWRRIGALTGAVALAVVMAGAPGGAQSIDPTTVGVGTTHGDVVFTDGTSVPPLGAECRATTFDVSGVANIFIFNTVLTGFPGTAEFGGSGSSDCDSVEESSGLLTLTATGVGPTGSLLDCGPLDGGFTRTLTHATVEVTGPCTINLHDVGDVTFHAEVVLTPTEGDGITTDVTRARFDGAFVVALVLPE